MKKNSPNQSSILSTLYCTKSTLLKNLCLHIWLGLRDTYSYTYTFFLTLQTPLIFHNMASLDLSTTQTLASQKPPLLRTTSDTGEGGTSLDEFQLALFLIFESGSSICSRIVTSEDKLAKWCTQLSPCPIYTKESTKRTIFLMDFCIFVFIPRKISLCL